VYVKKENTVENELGGGGGMLTLLKESKMQLEICVEQWKDLYLGTYVIVLVRLGTGKGKMATV
jgi:hypothetical protein